MLFGTEILLVLHKEISHGRISSLKGTDIDEWQKQNRRILRSYGKIS